MAVLVFSLVGAVVVGGLFWAFFGSKLSLAKENTQNDVLNVAVYLICAFVLVFPVVLFIIA